MTFYDDIDDDFVNLLSLSLYHWKLIMNKVIFIRVEQWRSQFVQPIRSYESNCSSFYWDYYNSYTFSSAFDNYTVLFK